MLEDQKPSEPGASTPRYRIDSNIHDKLMKPLTIRGIEQQPDSLTLPDPVYPQRDYSQLDESASAYQKFNAIRGLKGWAIPYVKSRWHNKELRPIIAYLFTEYKCNLDCHYCWSYNNKVRGMSEATARKAIDWLHSIGNRVLALMGGEPLLRPEFVHKVVDYGSKKGFFVYLPTNGRLMKPDVIDRIGDAGVAIVNLAVDSVDERPELPKALNPIRPYFDYLIKMQKRYRYSVAFNINITRINMEDVRELTKIARDNGIATDYHINEAPMIEQDHFQHMDENATYLRPEDYAKADETLDWLMDLHDKGYKMINPRQHLADMKDLMRGEVKPWVCRAGQNTVIVRTDGTLAPCFPMYSAKHDWGSIGDHKFDGAQLDEMKVSCNKHCLSTCNYILAYSYDNARVVQWLAKQALRGFKGTSGSF